MKLSYTGIIHHCNTLSRPKIHHIGICRRCRRRAPHASATPRPTAITLPTPTPTATLDAAGLRQRRLAAGFSAWDGSHIALTRAIKAAMHDPSSYQHVDTTYIDRGDYLVVTTTYRGRNAFGAIVEHSITAHTDLDGAIIRIVAQTP